MASKIIKSCQKTSDLSAAIIATLCPDSLLIDKNMTVVRAYGDIGLWTKHAGIQSNMPLDVPLKELLPKTLYSRLETTIIDALHHSCEKDSGEKNSGEKNSGEKNSCEKSIYENHTGKKNMGERSALSRVVTLHDAACRIRITLRPLLPPSTLEHLLLLSFEKSEHSDKTGSTLQNQPSELHQLQLEQERYELAIEGSKTGIWDWDIASDTMYWSNTLKHMLGTETNSRKLTFETFLHRIHDDDREDVASIIKAHLERGFELDVEFAMRKDKGDYIWVHAIGQALWDNNNKPLRMTGSLHNVTERRQALEALNQTNESLERFAYVCSHDLKEPARVIENFAELFREQYAGHLDARAKQYLQFIEDSACRMQDMIKGILTCSQLQNKNLALQAVDLEAECDKVQENLKLAIEESHAIITYDALPTVKADKIQIFQVLQNLIGNALKFCKQKKPSIHISAAENAHEWIIKVKDNGIGMKAEHTKKIFHVFQRLNHKEEYEGNGIGLSICHQIIRKHGGKIWVESSPGQGATFFFTIPKKKNRGLLKYDA